MNQIRYLFLFLAFVSFTDIIGQPFKIGTSSSIFRDTDRSNRRIPLTVYYPAMDEGIDVPLTSNNNEKFPVICFGHGYLLGLKAYKNIVEAIVPEGYILLVPEPEGGLFPSHKAQAEDLVFVLDEFAKMAGIPSSLFFNRTDSLQGLMGFSMGGGSALVAASCHPGIHALIALAPYNTRPSAIESSSAVSVPALIFSGSNDCITPPEEHQLPMYHSLTGRDRTWIQITGGTHCQMINKNSTCRFGESVKRCKPDISQEEQHRIIESYLLPWLDFYLKGNTESGRQFDLKIESDPAIEYLRIQPLSEDYRKIQQ